MSGPLAVQPATAASAHRSTTPFFTGGYNEIRRRSVTGVIAWRKSHTIPPGACMLQPHMGGGPQ